MKNKTLRLVYGFNPTHPRSEYESYAVSRSYVYVIGINNEWKQIATFDSTDTDNRSTTWKNETLTMARNCAERYSKFYGVKPERMEGLKVVPRSFKYTEAACISLGINHVN